MHNNLYISIMLLTLPCAIISSENTSKPLLMPVNLDDKTAALVSPNIKAWLTKNKPFFAKSMEGPEGSVRISIQDHRTGTLRIVPIETAMAISAKRNKSGGKK